LVQRRELGPIEERTQWLAAENQMKIKFTLKAQQKLGLRTRMTRTEADRRIFIRTQWYYSHKGSPWRGVGMTTSLSSGRQVVRFGAYEADLRAGELRKNGLRIRLSEQPFQVLTILLEHPGEVVAREELQKRLWPDGTFVDFEQGLNAAVKRLREVLDDSADTPHLIETVPRRGYRFVGSLGSSTGRIQSLAVLPLENLSGDPEQEYFAEGLTEALINTVAKIGALRVTSRTSAMRYRKTDKNVPQIARELNVDAIVEGTVLRSGDRVRISVQLIDAHADTHLWAESYDRDLRDILALHSEVAQAVAREVQVKLTPYDYAHFAHTHPVDPQAYEDYLKGRYYWNRRPAELGKAIQYFERAIKKDPGYAAAFTGLADCLNSLTGLGIAPPNEGSVKARLLAQRALEIGHSLAEAHTALALASIYDYDFLTAEREFEQAIELNPRYAHAHSMFSFHLAWTGRYEEAYAEIQRALRLDPLSSITNSHVGWIYLYGRRYDQAIEQLQKTLEMDPNSGSAWGFLGWAQSCKSQHESAIASLRKACELWPGSPPVAWLGQVYATAGYRDEAQKILKQLQELSKRQYVTSYEVGRIYAALGQKDEAFRRLEAAYEQRSNWMVLLKVDPLFDDLRPDPRFQHLLRRMNFPA
jgi:TolB-like protein/Flp pilus assembly protein TadD